MEKKDIRTAKILWSKSGKGSDTSRITLPVSWVRKMQLTKEDREVQLIFDEEAKEFLLKKINSKSRKNSEIFSLFLVLLKKYTNIGIFFVSCPLFLKKMWYDINIK